MSNVVWRHKPRAASTSYLLDVLVPWVAGQGLDASTLSPEAYITKDADGVLTFHYQQIEMDESGRIAVVGDEVIQHDRTITVPDIPAID